MTEEKRRSNPAQDAPARKRAIAILHEQQTNAELEAELVGKLGEVLPKEEAEKAVSVVHEVVASSFSGPLPPPSVLQGYNNVSPGSADRIIAMAEKEQQQRHA